MILLDTQTVIWWSTAPEHLSKKALQQIEKEIKTNGLLVSSMSVWEIYLLLKKRRVNFKTDVDSLIEKLENLSYLQFIPITNKIAASSVNLPEPLHKDPADRIIIATAREYGATLITSDQQIRGYKHVQTLW